MPMDSSRTRLNAWPQIMLHGKHIFLGPLHKEDSGTLWSWINDRRLVSLSGCPKPVHEDNHAEWFRALTHACDMEIFAIRRRDDELLIGSCQLHSIHPVYRSAELQIRIGIEEETAKGYGTEAVRLLTRYGFHDLNLNRIFLHVFASNARAVRVYEKCGYVREGLLRQAAHVDGHPEDLMVMAILREDWKADERL